MVRITDPNSNTAQTGTPRLSYLKRKTNNGFGRKVIFPKRTVREFLRKLAGNGIVTRIGKRKGWRSTENRFSVPEIPARSS